MNSFYPQVSKELTRLGFVYKAPAKGSHEKWVNSNNKLIVVPYNLKSRHTANAILKDAGSSLKL